MTREEAIGFGKMWLDINSDAKDSLTYEFFEQALEALKAEPCDEQSVYMRAYREGYDKGYADGDFFARHEGGIKESCEDAVKREAVLNTLDTMDKALDENRTVEHYKELLAECYKALPPVTPKQRTGKWIEDVVRDDFIDYEDIFYVCDCCNESACQPYKYCPNCGAKMEGESE